MCDAECARANNCFGWSRAGVSCERCGQSFCRHDLREAPTGEIVCDECYVAIDSECEQEDDE